MRESPVEVGWVLNRVVPCEPRHRDNERISFVKICRKHNLARGSSKGQGSEVRMN